MCFVNMISVPYVLPGKNWKTSETAKFSNFQIIFWQSGILKATQIVRYDKKEQIIKLILFCHKILSISQQFPSTFGIFKENMLEI